jgi:UDP-N-acetyl-D-glucosamine dehydrogenase
MPGYVVDRLTNALVGQGKPLKGANILLVGVSYKRDVADIREAPAIAIINILMSRGANVNYHDPYVPRLLTKSPPIQLLSKELTEELISSADGCDRHRSSRCGL